jgi:ribonuclease P protein component
VQRLRKRQDFVRLRDGRKAHAATLTLQSRLQEVPGEARAGFTVTKKTCVKAVARNRIRRRLREAMRLIGALHARAGHDYVVIGRRAALEARFPTILSELSTAFDRVHAARPQARRQAGRSVDEAAR